MAKPLKRANGSGAIIKASGNRRKPYQVIVTVGWDDNGKQIRKSLGYFETRDKATVALANYNENPYDISGGKATFSEVYDKWSSQKFPNISESNIKSYKACFKQCTFLYDKKFKDIGVDDLQYVVDNADCNYPTLRKLKVLFTQLYKYAVPRKLTDRDYASAVDIKKYKHKNPNKKDKTIFTTEEIEKIKSLDSLDIARTILMLIYSGMRIGELLNLEKRNCHLDEHYIYVARETTKNDESVRYVPISEKTIDYWYYFFNKPDGDYLISMDGRDFSKSKGYTAYQKTYWKSFLQKLEITHDIHETRHTCSTMLHSAEVYEAKINRILGHVGKTISENVYSHLDIKDLIEAINKI